ncbi:MAG TPA: uracil phosphoribosyltransferase, partial [Bacteroidia bacterium]|nr:uracil phosphoribosyltransferase [Bacteroidia bacterium]
MPHILCKQNSIVNHFIAELRNVDVQNDRMRFRRNLERIGEIAAFEISKTFDYIQTEVTTPLGIATVSLMAEQPILATILRAGLPLH